MQDDNLVRLVQWLSQEESVSHLFVVLTGLKICHQLSNSGEIEIFSLLTLSAAESKQALIDANGITFFNLASTRYDDNFDIQYLSATGIASLSELAEYDSENSEEDDNSYSYEDDEDNDDDDDEEENDSSEDSDVEDSGSGEENNDGDENDDSGDSE